jgi:hypothetical protein
MGNKFLHFNQHKYRIVFYKKNTTARTNKFTKARNKARAKANIKREISREA